jgi:glycyl-tRNA synthetase
VAILPLVKKDGLPEIAEKIYNDLKFDFNCFYEEKDTIGKRYRRQDAIGTPFCVTIDYDSVQDSSVTLRYRDSMEQKRIKIDELHGLISEEVSWKKLLNNL